MSSLSVKAERCAVNPKFHDEVLLVLVSYHIVSVIGSDKYKS